MKIKALSRSTSSYQPPGSTIPRAQKNLQPEAHPFERGREYVRALNAVKLERMFANPFIGDFGRGHVDGVYSVAKDGNSLERLSSGSGDGVVKVWNLANRSEVWQTNAHDNIVKGMVWTGDQKLLSCGTDKTVKLWDPYHTPSGSAPVATYLGNGAFTSITHHRRDPAFAASSSSTISIYDLSRSATTPVQSMAWPTSTDTINCVKWNQVERSILASTASDRSIVLYDARTQSPIAKTTLQLASNCLAWNPQEAMNFVVGNEDHNMYMFDQRKMDRALNVFKGHVAAVMDVAFSPTGEELVSASYDRSLRLWHRNQGQSRDCYHTKRMQRVFCSVWSGDNNFVISGSDDGNVRLWRAQASGRQGVKSARQRQKLEYDATLKERYKHMPEIRRIARHRHIPKTVKKAGEIKGEELKAIKRREENERRHTKKGTVRRKAEREKMVLRTEE